MITVLACGCFDLLHVGHILHLQEAALLGDRLIVALTVDECVNKPGRPINPWRDRSCALLALGCVDSVIASKNAATAIYAVRPQIFVKGSDYEGAMPYEDVSACMEVGARIVTTMSPKYSTTALIEKIRASA